MISNAIKSAFFTTSNAIKQTIFLFVSEEIRSLSIAEDRFRLYDGVETFVLFIGYPRSSHSLVGAILDAHPEIVIPHEFNLLNVWNRFRKLGNRQEKLQKYLLFYELQQLSTRQALFGIRANNSLYQGESAYTYNIPKLWQGGYHKRIKVSYYYFFWQFEPEEVLKMFF